MEQRIILRPLVQIENHLLQRLRQSLEQAFDYPVAIREQIISLDYAYDLGRKQYLAPRLLSTLRGFEMEPGDRCLGIVDVDLYSAGLNFVFGEADTSSGVAIISLYRLRQERYGLPPDEGLFRDRATKEAVHELGHLYYLRHCPGVNCVMHFSNSLADTDVKRASFCQKCQQRLQEAKDKP